MAGAAWLLLWLPGGAWLGFVLGKAVADVVWYVLWVIHLRDDGRCTWFEEWPFWPGRPHAAAREHP